MKTVSALLLLAFCVGCGSIRSTMLNRMEDDTLVGNSNGTLRKHGQTRPYKGVPITIQVPTHVEVAVLETFFLTPDGKGGLNRIRTSRRNFDVKTNLVMSDKVIMVDFKRPMSGELDYHMKFQTPATVPDKQYFNPANGQYFDSISTYSNDTTITDIAKLIATAVPAVTKAASLPLPTGAFTNDVIIDQRVVAFRRFDIDACDFEQQMQQFLDEQINCCHTCDSDAPAPETVAAPPAKP